MLVRSSAQVDNSLKGVLELTCYPEIFVTFTPDVGRTSVKGEKSPQTVPNTRRGTPETDLVLVPGSKQTKGQSILRDKNLIHTYINFRGGLGLGPAACPSTEARPSKA
jgi:hypothetical protein